jgi:hypothetical protein
VHGERAGADDEELTFSSAKDHRSAVIKINSVPMESHWAASASELTQADYDRHAGCTNGGE